MASKKYYASNNGTVSCELHGGNYFTSVLYNEPNIRKFVTPLDYWVRLTKKEVEEIREWNPEVCECCYQLAKKNA
jgi:hypothetical protein